MTITSRDPLHSVGKLSDIEFQLRFGMSKEQARHINDEKARQKRYNLHAVKRRIDESLKGVSIESHTNSEGKANLHHIHVKGRHVASIEGPHRNISDTGHVQSGHHYDVMSASHGKKAEAGESFSTKDKEGNWGHPEFREPRQSKEHSGVKNLLGMKKSHVVSRQGTKRFASLHQAVRAVKQKHDEGKLNETFINHIINEAAIVVSRKVGDHVRVTRGPHKGIPHKIIHIHDDGGYNVVPVIQKGEANMYRLGAARCTEKELEQPPKQAAAPAAKAPKAAPKPKEPEDKSGHVSVKNKEGKFAGRFKSMADAEKAAPADKGHTYHMHKVNEDEINELSKNLLGRYIGKSFPAHDAAARKTSSFGDMVRADNAYGDKERAAIHKKEFIKHDTKRDNRRRGIETASKKIAEGEEVNEVSKDLASRYFDKAAGSRSAAEKAGNAKVLAKRDAGTTRAFNKITERDELISELSKSLVGRYIPKAQKAKAFDDKYAPFSDSPETDEYFARRNKNKVKGISMAKKKVNEEVVSEGALANVAMNAARRVHRQSAEEAEKHISDAVMGIVNQHKGSDRVKLHGAAGDAIRAGVAHRGKLNEARLSPTHHVHMKDSKGKPCGKVAVSAPDHENAKWQGDQMAGKKPFRGMTVGAVTRINEEALEEGKAYVKPHGENGFKSSDKHGHVKFWNEHGKASAHKHAGLNEEEDMNLLEARRGRPPKNAAPGREEDEREHVMMQLRKSVSLNGSKPLKFKDGSSHHVSPNHAEHALAHYAGMSPAHKEMFQGHIDQSHHNLMNYDKWKPTQEVKHFDHRPLTGASARTIKKPVDKRPQYLTPMQKRLNLIKAVVAKQAKR
jgi:hypothetical protein